MGDISKKAAKLASAAAGFALPYIENYINDKRQLSRLHDKIKELCEENGRLRRENQALKRRIIIAAAFAAAGFIAFIAVIAAFTIS